MATTVSVVKMSFFPGNIQNVEENMDHFADGNQLASLFDDCRCSRKESVFLIILSRFNFTRKSG
ncbi:MAG: hypothetical protein B6240_08175 [Desulfobacteraceae bacterium 4572_87]|nr:MAG: hypothetical protein B6240_08175 [Desulfobacteraceae bacterium 4572_87]